jgi:glycosidase
MKKYSFIVLLYFTNLMVQAQHIERVEPPNWWVGMKHHKLELLIYGKGISNYTPSINHSAVSLVKTVKTENDNYLFITIDVSKAEAGIFSIDFSENGEKDNFSYNYELKERIPNSDERIGFNSSDAIYLITPDRFANGDKSNNNVIGLKEQGIDRGNDEARHGGDIEGITKHLDYIEAMGFTAIWPTPLLTNDMYQTSYHGYAITDFYEVDPRFGTLAEYVNLSQKAKEKGLKLIMDQVVNHIGVEHWWMNDLPSNDWINYHQEYKNKNVVVTNHRRTVNQDIYASLSDKKLMNDGWFVEAMPDLNQKNSLLATYLIQNSIWWIETLDLCGIRQDTYPYSDKEFMAKWAGAIMYEYPHFSIVGEEWSLNPLIVGYWQQGAKNKDGYQSNLSSTMDFPMQHAIVEGINAEEGWDTGFVKMYEGLANDFYYANPSAMMIFPDNHDMSRIYTQLNENLVNTQMAVGYMLVLPRIVQIYYGTEILMSDTQKRGNHGFIRSDFSGGWQDDEINAFTGVGLSADQEEMQLFLKKALNYRKNSEAIHIGKTVHFAPEKAVYVLFRIKGNEIVVAILNKNEDKITLDLNRFSEIGLQGKKVKNIVSNNEFIWNESLELDAKGIILLTTKL